MRGFTLVELILTVAILGLLAAFSLPPIRSFQRSAELHDTAEELRSTLLLARERTLASEEASSYGVYFDTGALPHAVVLFRGASYGERDEAADERRALPDSVEIYDIALVPEGSETTFQRLTGKTSSSGAVSLRLISSPDRTVVLRISSDGNVQVGGAAPGGEGLLFDGGTTDGDLGSFPNNAGWGDIGQTFTTGSDPMSAGTVRLFLKRATASPSDVFLEIRSGTTVGPVLGTSQQIAGSSLPDAMSWVPFSFSPSVSLDPESVYALRLRSSPPSTQAFSGASGTVHWGYVHSAFSPPAYQGGDAWRYIGRNGSESDQGQQLGPSDQYDFSFELAGSELPAPSSTDSRHVNIVYQGRNIDTNAEDLVLSFSKNGDAHEERIALAGAISDGQIEWEGSAEVGGETQALRVHTLLLNDPSEGSVFSVHRDGRTNTSALEVSLSGDVSGTIISYEEDGTVQEGTSIYAQDPQIQ